MHAGIEEVDAVISSVGGSVKDARADGDGNINLIEAAVKKGVKKFVLITSVGCGSSKAAPGEQVRLGRLNVSGRLNIHTHSMWCLRDVMHARLGSMG